MGNTNGRPPRPPPRRFRHTRSDPVYPLYMCPQQVDEGPVFPIQPIFADQPRKHSRPSSRNFTGSKRRYASRTTPHKSRRIETYFPSTLDPDETLPWDALFLESKHPDRKRHRPSETYDYYGDTSFQTGLGNDTGYQLEELYCDPPQYISPARVDTGPQLQKKRKKRRHAPRRDLGYQPMPPQSYEQYNQPPPIQPAASGCAIPHGGHIVPLVKCPHDMLGCMVCGRCYHDE